MVTNNGQGDMHKARLGQGSEEGDRARELIALQEAVGYLAKQQSADHLSSQEQFRRIEEKLELWIRTNQSLMEGQQETAKSNHRLVEAILANTSEMQRTTQEQQRSETSFEKGTHLLSELENRLKALERQTQGFGQATTDLNAILTSWKPVLDKTTTVMEVLSLRLPQQMTSGSSKQVKNRKPGLSQELNECLKESPTSDETEDRSQSENQGQSSRNLNSSQNQIKRYIAITRRDVLLTSRFNLGWGIFSTIVVLGLLGFVAVNNSERFSAIAGKVETVHKVLERIK
ncbi:MAG: hypothetical protein WCD18_05525 [Thermosynechococcaceae cyanobacterium]